MGTYVGVHEQGMHAMGLSNSTSFLRPIFDGTIHATARPFHRGRTTWLWDVEIRDDDDRLCATTRMTIAVRGRAAGVLEAHRAAARASLRRRLSRRSVRDRHAAVAAEGAAGDLDAGRRLAALVLGAVDERDHAVDVGSRRSRASSSCSRPRSSST